MPAKFIRIVVGKGKTIKPTAAEEWCKTYYEVEAEVPETYTAESVDEIRLQLEYLIDNWLGGPEAPAAPKIPEFNAEELMKHEWRGKRIAENQWEKGSLAFGWDFLDKFSKETIEVLKRGHVTVDQYTFGLNESGTLVQTKKESKRKTAR